MEPQRVDLSQLEILLEPHIEEPRMKRKMRFFFPLIGRTSALSNYPSFDLVELKRWYIDTIFLWLKAKQEVSALKRVIEAVGIDQGARSVRGFERMAQVTQRTISIAEERGVPESRPGFLRRIFGIGGGEKQPGQQV
jgi:hypothetical protein